MVFVHGWSVTNTDTYGGLPEALVRNRSDLQVSHIYLSKYVTFADEVTLDDISRGMQSAIETEIKPLLSGEERFACITHSTGGPVVRQWIDNFYRDDLAACPLSHLIMLAPANHGSALAQLGKGRLSRMKFFKDGVEPGTRVLDWLELGSDEGWDLNSRWLSYDCVDAGLYLFVLSGQRIDRHLYDQLNSYTDEAGSDGVVRVAAANMNYGLVRLVQNGKSLQLSKEQISKRCCLGVLPGVSHSGARMGIMAGVAPGDDGSHPTVKWVSKCLSVRSASGYQRLAREMADLTDQTQKEEREEKTRELFLFERTFITNRYCMLVVRLSDDRGNQLTDYDLTFTAGPEYDPNHLPPGFFVDRQKNLCNPGKLTYYVDFDVMERWLGKPELEGKFGIRVAARPAQGFAYYPVAEHRGSFASLKHYLEPNRTLMIDVQLKRHVVEGVFRLTQEMVPEDFRKQQKGADLP